MKIEDKKTEKFLNALLNLPNLRVRAIKFDTESPDFKSVLSGMAGSKVVDANFVPSREIDSITKEDIQFFKLCSENRELAINSINTKDRQVNFTLAPEAGQQVCYKTVNFSKGLFNLIEYSFKTQKPVRLDFQGNSSVILKVGNEGRLTAEFISNDAAMEYALKSSIPALKHKLDSENIPYGEIYYKDDEKQQNNKKKRNKGGRK